MVTSSNSADPRKTAHNLLVVRLLEFGQKLDRRSSNLQMAPWDRGELWKRADDNADGEVLALQAELMQMIADFDPTGRIFPSGPSGRVSPLVLRIIAVVSFRYLFSEWASMSLVDLVEAVAGSEDIASQLGARRSIVSLCLQGVLHGISQGVCQTIFIGPQLLAFLQGESPLVLPAPRPAPRADDQARAGANNGKRNKTQ